MKRGTTGTTPAENPALTSFPGSTCYEQKQEDIIINAANQQLSLVSAAHVTAAALKAVRETSIIHTNQGPDSKMWGHSQGTSCSLLLAVPCHDWRPAGLLS